MKADVLYVSLNPSFPFVEFCYKSNKNGPLTVFQFTRQRKGLKEAKKTAIDKFLERVGLTDVSNIRLFVVFSRPANA